MQEIINRVLSNNLADFEGLEVSGAIPLRDGFLNEAIASFLTSLQAGGAGESAPRGGVSTGGGTSSAPEVDTKALLQMVKKVEVQSQAGAVVIRFEVRR